MLFRSKELRDITTEIENLACFGIMYPAKRDIATEVEKLVNKNHRVRHVILIVKTFLSEIKIYRK